MILFHVFVYWRRKIHSPYPWVCPSFCPIVLIIHYFCWLLSFVFLLTSQNFNCFLSHINSKWFFSMSLFIEGQLYILNEGWIRSDVENDLSWNVNYLCIPLYCRTSPGLGQVLLYSDDSMYKYTYRVLFVFFFLILKITYWTLALWVKSLVCTAKPFWCQWHRQMTNWSPPAADMGQKNQKILKEKTQYLMNPL